MDDTKHIFRAIASIEHLGMRFFDLGSEDLRPESSSKPATDRLKLNGTIVTSVT